MSFRNQLRSLQLADPDILADAIALSAYTQGTRLVDAPEVQKITLRPGSTNSVDVTDTQSIDLVWTWTAPSGIPGATTTTAPWYGTLALNWCDAGGQRLYTDTVELAMPQPLTVTNTSKAGIVRCPAVGANLVLELLDASPGLPFPSDGYATISLIKSSRPTDRFRYAGVPDIGSGDDGQLLLVVGAAVAANATDLPIGTCEAFDGPVDLDVFASQAGTLRITGGARYRDGGAFRRSVTLNAGGQTHIAGVICPRTNLLIGINQGATAGLVTVMANRASV